MSLRHAILAAVSLKPQTGYELGKQIDGSIRYFWSATLQQIYKELGELEKAGWVNHKDVLQREKPSKKVYHITKNGSKELKSWVESESDPSPTKDALAIKIFVGQVASPGALRKELRRHGLIHSTKLKYYLHTQQQFKSANRLSVDLRFQYMTLLKGIFLEKAWLAWAKEVDFFLQENATNVRISKV
jgi:DNA-binding PadR family transcriptional regulator